MAAQKGKGASLRCPLYAGSPEGMSLGTGNAVLVCTDSVASIG